MHKIVEDLRRCAEQGRMSTKQWVTRAMLREIGLSYEDLSTTPAWLAFSAESACKLHGKLHSKNSVFYLHGDSVQTALLVWNQDRQQVRQRC